MKTLDVLCLIAIANTKDKSSISPADFFGIENHIKGMLDCPRETLQRVLWHNLSVAWDMESPLWSVVLAAAKVQCSIDRGYADMMVDKLHKESAMKILNYNKECPGVLSVSVVQAAQAVFDRDKGEVND